MSNAFIRYADGSLEVQQGSQDILDYAIDYRAILSSDGDTIVSSTWSASGDVTVSAPNVEGTVASAMIGGVNGTVENIITSANGRRKQVVFAVIEGQPQ